MPKGRRLTQADLDCDRAQAEATRQKHYKEIAAEKNQTRLTIQKVEFLERRIADLEKLIEQKDKVIEKLTT